MPDAVNILSFNPAKSTLKRFSKRHKRDYVSHYLQKEHPDICLLGDDIGNKLQEGLDEYRPVKIPSSGETVLLYDVNRVEITDQQSGLFTSDAKEVVNCDAFLCYKVDIYSQRPAQAVVKTFNLLTWGQETADLFASGTFSLFEGIIGCAQNFALTSQTPLLIGGESSMIISDAKAILNQRNKETQHRFLEQAHEQLESHGYLPSMTEGSTKTTRDLFKLQNIVSSGFDTHTTTQSSGLIASRSLQITSTPLQDIAGTKPDVSPSTSLMDTGEGPNAVAASKTGPGQMSRKGDTCTRSVDVGAATLGGALLANFAAGAYRTQETQ